MPDAETSSHGIGTGRAGFKFMSEKILKENLGRNKEKLNVVWDAITRNTYGIYVLASLWLCSYTSIVYPQSLFIYIHA